MVHAGCILLAITGLLAPQMGHALKVSEDSQHTNAEIIAAAAEKPLWDTIGDAIIHSLGPIFQDGPGHKALPRPDQFILDSFSRGSSKTLQVADELLQESDRFASTTENATWSRFAGELYNLVSTLTDIRDNQGGRQIDLVCATFTVVTTTDLRDGCRHLTSSVVSMRNASSLARELISADPLDSTADISGKLTQLNASLHDAALESRLGNPGFITGLPQITFVLDGMAHLIHWKCDKDIDFCIPTFLDKLSQAVATAGQTNAFQIDRMLQSVASSMDRALQLYNFKSKSNAELQGENDA